jgi:TonB family protein
MNAGSPQANDPLAPKLMDIGDLAILEQYYPPKAKQMGIEGIVNVLLKIDPQGHVADARVIHEDPANPEWGFAEAAARVVLTLRFSNPRGVTTEMPIKVKFALDPGKGGPLNAAGIPPATDVPPSPPTGPTTPSPQ